MKGEAWKALVQHWAAERGDMHSFEAYDKQLREFYRVFDRAGIAFMPREPTEEMLVAYRQTHMEFAPRGEAAWEAMLTAGAITPEEAP